MAFIKRRWTPKEADEWRKEDWIAKLKMISSEYEKKQKEYLLQLEKIQTWEETDE